MANPPSTAVSKHLVWVFLQGVPFMSVAAGPSVIEGLVRPERPWWPILGVSALLFLCVTYALVRNLVRLWRAPASEARPSHRLALIAVGVVFVVLASGPLVEGRQFSTKPLGFIWLVVGLNVIALGIREILRLRGRQSAPAGT